MLDLVITRTYSDFIEFGMKEIALSTDNEQRRKSLKSHLNQFMKFCGVCGDDQIETEFSALFEKRLQSHLDTCGLKDNKDRKSALLKWKDIYTRYIQTDGLPESFAGALDVLIENHGGDLIGLAKKVRTSKQNLSRWINGKAITPKNFNKLIRLEKELNVAAGTLSNRIQTKVITPPKISNEFGKKISELQKYPYRINHFEGELKQEWDAFLKHKTSIYLTDGKKRNQAWKVSGKCSSKIRVEDDWVFNNGDVCPSGRKTCESLYSFFGFCLLPTDSDVLYLKGLGFNEDQLTLALLTEPDVVLSFFEFQKNRSSCFSEATTSVLAFLNSLLRKETGWLIQSPEFGKKLPNPIPEEKWVEHCLNSKKVFNEFESELKKTNSIRKGREPKANTAHITSSKDPIGILVVAIQKMAEDSPILNRYLNATHCRNLALFSLITSNPQREHIFSNMTYKKDNSGNLYQDTDGVWRIHISLEDFKNWRFITDTEYDVEVTEFARPFIEDYINNHRPALLKGAESDYFFVSTTGGQWFYERVYRTIKEMTNKYIGERLCPYGMGPHDFRHVIATGYLKLYPGCYQLVAKILHDKLQTVIDNYSHLEASDGLNVLSEHINNIALNRQPTILSHKKQVIEITLTDKDLDTLKSSGYISFVIEKTDVRINYGGGI